MGNVLRVFARDAVRIARVPAAWLVALFLIVLPSLYTWFNVVGFWDPYGNTSNLRICVANEDEGADDEMLGRLDLGEQIVEQLKGDDQLGWDFTDRDEAMAAVESGSAYAAFIIPSDFSADVATLLSGDPTPPALEYYVNEKLGPVSPKITDTGANTLDTAINDEFVSQASKAIAQELDEGMAQAEGDAEAVRDGALSLIDKADASLSSARETLAGLKRSASDAQAEVVDSKASLDQAKSDIQALSGALGDISSLAAEIDRGLVEQPLALGDALDKASRLLSQASSGTSESIGEVSSAISAAQGDVEGSIAGAQAVVEGNARLIEMLKGVQAGMADGSQKETLGQLIATLEQGNQNAQATLEDAGALSSSLDGAASSLATAAGDADDAVQGSLSAADGFRSVLADDTVPALSGALSDITGAASGLSAAVANQQALVEQTSSVLDQLSTTLGAAAEALEGADSLLAGLQGDFSTTRTDIAALGSSDALADALGGDLDPDSIASFMMSPTQVETEKLYPLNAYGSGMAPLFINLTLWIGVFMLMVIMRLEADGEDIAGITAAQRYFGRWLLLAAMAALQALVCCAGCLAIGVQTVNAPAFLLTAVIASQAYLAIQYMLSSLFQHVGKGLCIVLVFVQIPAATGLYPIEMTTPFFQAVYPAFPFTYGINAMREVIGGFYDGAWLSDVGVLAAFFAASMAIGVILRPHAANLNRMFDGQIQESGLINGERVQVPERRYKVEQVILALTDRKVYRTALARRAARFLQLYPKLKLAAFVAGIAVPVVAAVALSVAQADKVVLLTVWLAWLVAIIVFLIVVEYVRDGLRRQAALGDLDDEGVRSLLAADGGEGGASR